MPPDAIHTIPIRLDDLVVPEQFHPLQWSDLQSGRFDRIVQALRLGMEQRRTVVPAPALEPPPDPIPHQRPSIFPPPKDDLLQKLLSTPHRAEAYHRLTARTTTGVRPSPAGSRSCAIVSLVIAVSALAAVIVVVPGRE